MKVEIENGKIVGIIEFLYDLKLVRKQSRHRRHFINILKEKFKQFEEDRKALLEEHAEKDAEGKAIINDGRYDIKDMVAYSEDLKELEEEINVIEGGDNREMIRTLQQVLKKREDVEYEGKESETYDYLCEQFRIDEEEQEEQEEPQAV